MTEPPQLLHYLLGHPQQSGVYHVLLPQEGLLHIPLRQQGEVQQIAFQAQQLVSLLLAPGGQVLGPAALVPLQAACAGQGQLSLMAAALQHVA